MSGFEALVSAWHERWKRDAEADAAAARRAQELCQRLAEILRDRHGASRVVLFGSLARGEFRRGSDIDLAAAGIDPARFFRAGADLDAAAGGVRIDLVPLECADPRLLATLESEGIVLHDAAAA